MAVETQASTAEIDELIAVLQAELATLVDAGEAVVQELDALEELRGRETGDGNPLSAARQARLDAVRERERARELTDDALRLGEWSRALARTSATRMASPRRRVRARRPDVDGHG